MIRIVGRAASAVDSGAALEARSVRTHRWDISATYVMLLLTTAALVLAFRQLGGSLLHSVAGNWSAVIGGLMLALVVGLLIWGNFVYQLTRLGHLYRLAVHRPASRKDLEQIYERAAPSLAILVPSYKEEFDVVSCTLLSAALQEYPNRRIALLIDDPTHPQHPADIAGLRALRELPNQLQVLFDAAAKPFIQAEREFHSRPLHRQMTERREFDKLAWLYWQAARRVEGWRALVGGATAAGQLLLERVLGPIAESHRVRSTQLASCHQGDRQLLAREYRRLASLFSVGFTVFERKRYENLSHEPNKAMNLNSYLSLLGGRFREVRRSSKLLLEPACGGPASFAVPAAEFVITLDADSLLMPEYALRLGHEMCRSGRERLAVAQTPYSSIPAAPGSLEYVAGATTDIQYLIHQGFTAFGATFWVGANALLRVAALNDIKTHDLERGYPIVRYIQDRTVIEDTESSIDLIERGWTLYNYPERLAFSATPPDFGALLIQRRRWANGGLIILPKCIRHLWRTQSWTKIPEAYFRLHYLGSITLVNLGLVLMLMFPVDDRLSSAWLPLTAFPYFVLYGRDLVRMGYRWRDLVLVYALNLLLIPINLGGVLKSIRQAATRRKIPFGRTPKVMNRTAAPAFYLLAEYALLIWLSLAFVFDSFAHRWTHAAFAAFNAAFLGFAIHSYIGWPATVEDLRTSWRSRPRAMEALLRPVVDDRARAA